MQTWGIERITYWLLAALAGICTFILRAVYLGRSYNIFIDEITYLKISTSVAQSLKVVLYGKPFFLHPPAYFFLEAAYLKILAPPDTATLVAQVYSIRYLNVIIASLIAILLFMIGYRVMGIISGALAVCFFALDPFIIRINSLNLLDTAAIAWVLAGYWVIISSTNRTEETVPSLRFPMIRKKTAKKTKRRHSSKKSIHTINPVDLTPASINISARKALLAGGFFGLALLTKETTAFLTLAPIAVCFLLNWAIPRRTAVIIAVTGYLTYLIYPLTVFLSGDWNTFATQKFRGILRFAGVVKITGLNRGTGPSFLSTLVDRLSLYSTTYILIGLGLIASLLLLRSRNGVLRLIGVWVTCTYVMMAYLIVLGTLEEQFFLYLVVPGLLAFSIAIRWLLGSFNWKRILSSSWAVAIVIVFLLITGWDGYQWTRVHFTPDNGYEQLMSYLRKNVPGGERVASTSEVGQYLLEGYLSGPYGLWSSVSALKKYHPEYLLATPQTIEWNYGAGGKELVNWVQQNGEPVFNFTGREGDEILLYRIKGINLK